MLGEAFYQQFKEEYDIKITDIDLNENWISYLDFRDFTAYRKDVLDFQPDYLFHLGAHTDLEYCEKNSDDAYLTNTIAVENAVYISNELNIPLLYISTAGIFDGKKDVYDDWDQPNPLGHYARSKYMGEKFVVENKVRYLICRAGWMMGGGPAKDKKFIGKILRQLKEGKKELHIVNDKFGTPTYTHDFASNVKLLLEQECWGLYNLACEGETNRVAVTRELLRLLQLENAIVVKEVGSVFFNNEYFAERPSSERLVNRKLNLRQLNTMRGWETCLREYLDTYYKNYFS